MIFRGGGVMSSLSSFFSPNCQKITWGHHRGVRHPHVGDIMGASQGGIRQFWQLGEKTSLVFSPNCPKKIWGHHGGVRCPPCYFLTIWWKKLDKTVTVNQLQTLISIHLHINNLLKLFFLWIWTTPSTPRPYQRPPHPPWKSYFCPIFSTKTNIFYLQSMFRLSFHTNTYSFNMKYTYIWLTF